MAKIKKGDTVIVTSGDAKGQKGKVLSVLVSENRILVEGVNMRKKTIKSRDPKVKAETVEVPATLHISNVALVVDGKPTRVGYKVEDGKKVRVAKKTGNVIK